MFGVKSAARGGHKLRLLGAAHVPLHVDRPLSRQEETNNFALRPFWSVVPMRQLKHAHHAHARTGTPLDGPVGIFAQGVPGRGESPLDEL